MTGWRIEFQTTNPPKFVVTNDKRQFTCNNEDDAQWLVKLLKTPPIRGTDDRHKMSPTQF